MFAEPSGEFHNRNGPKRRTRQVHQPHADDVPENKQPAMTVQRKREAPSYTTPFLIYPGSPQGTPPQSKPNLPTKALIKLHNQGSKL